MTIVNETTAERKWENATAAQPCTICGKPDWCSRSADGVWAVCRREDDGTGEEREDCNGDLFWLYRTGAESDSMSPSDVDVPDEVVPAADADTCHAVYSAFLDGLTLNNEHITELQKRGLDVTDTKNPWGYRSRDNNWYRGIERVQQAGLENALASVPGFIRAKSAEGTEFWNILAGCGLLIPVRDVAGRIVALLLRPDDPDAGKKYCFLSSTSEGGPGPGSPIHVPLFSGDKQTVRVTEGALKADIATALSGRLTIGLPGVNAARRAAGVLQQLGARNVLLAFDADAQSNPHVARSLQTLANSLYEAGFGVSLEDWDITDGKGIDDLLAAGKQPKVITGAEVATAIVSIVDAAEKAEPAEPAEVIPQTTPTTRNGDAPLPAIYVNGCQPRERVGRAWDAVLAANEPPRLFQQGGMLVQLREKNGVPYLHTMDEIDVYGHLIHIADWLAQKDGADRDAEPPGLLRRLMAAAPDKRLPVIDAILTSPVFGSSGTLIDTPGYHPADRVWYHRPDGFPHLAVPQCPSRTQVDEAKGLILDDLLGDFPFVGDADRAHAMAARLNPFARRLIDGCVPLHLVEAPTVGAGKTLLCRLVTVVATGGECEARTMPKTEDEMRKMVTSEMLTGRPVVLLDNVVGLVDSPALASVLTIRSWTDRILGKSEMVTLPSHALWFVTGNNPQLSMELARRSVRIRIDPETDRPWKRSGFKHPQILPWAAENRSRLVQAALTLIQAWLAAGRPQHSQRLGSFESWSDVMGGILHVAGVDGFLGNLEALYEEADAEGQMWRTFVAAWWETHGDNEVKVADLIALCVRNDLMEDVRGPGTEHSQQTRLGKALQQAKDRVFDRWRIAKVKDKKNKSNSYALRCQSATAGSAAGGDDAVPSDDASAGGWVDLAGGWRDLTPAKKCLENKAQMRVAGGAVPVSGSPKNSPPDTSDGEAPASQPRENSGPANNPRTPRRHAEMAENTGSCGRGLGTAEVPPPACDVPPEDESSEIPVTNARPAETSSGDTIPVTPDMDDTADFSLQSDETDGSGNTLDWSE